MGGQTSLKQSAGEEKRVPTNHVSEKQLSDQPAGVRGEAGWGKQDTLHQPGKSRQVVRQWNEERVRIKSFPTNQSQYHVPESVGNALFEVYRAKQPRGASQHEISSEGNKSEAWIQRRSSGRSDYST